MICSGCNQRFEFTQGRFHKIDKQPDGRIYDWYCGDCTPKVPIDGKTQAVDRRRPEPATAGLGGSPEIDLHEINNALYDSWPEDYPYREEPERTLAESEREQVPIEAYEDCPF